MFEPTVPKWVYDQKCAEYAALLEKYHALRPTHSASSPIRVTAPKEEPGLATLHAAEAAVNNPRLALIADNLMRQKPELTRAQALTEAYRLDSFARGRATIPPVAPPGEPPSR